MILGAMERGSDNIIYPTEQAVEKISVNDKVDTIQGQVGEAVKDD
jgi:hypothetical protein